MFVIVRATYSDSQMNKSFISHFVLMAGDAAFLLGAAAIFISAPPRPRLCTLLLSHTLRTGAVGEDERFVCLSRRRRGCSTLRAALLP